MVIKMAKLNKIAIGLTLSLVSTIFIAAIATADIQNIFAKGLKLYLTIDTNLANQPIRIDTNQYGQTVYSHSGSMNPGRNEITLQYPNHLVDNGPFEICVGTWNNGQSCGNGNNGEEKKPESVFVSLYGQITTP
jgi:hypothetical protein